MCWQTYEHLYMGFLCGEQKHSFKKSLCLDFAQKRRFYEQALNLERYSATGRGSVENVATRRQQLENSGDLQWIQLASRCPRHISPRVQFFPHSLPRQMNWMCFSQNLPSSFFKISVSLPVCILVVMKSPVFRSAMLKRTFAEHVILI